MDIWNKSKEPKETVSYMVEEITHICRKIGRRSPGSTGERAAAEYFAGVLEKKCGCTDVKTESFEENPDSFYGYFYFSAFCDILCGVFFFSRPLLSIFFGLLGVLLFVYHFVLYRKPLDPLFPRKQGTNVTAVRPCSGEVKQRIFLNGHTDAAWEFPINYRFGGIAFEIPGLAATVGVFYYIILSFLSLCGVDVYTAGLRGLVFLPFFLLLTITYNPLRVVDGANDNLTGCFLSMSILKEMADRGERFEDTEIACLITDGEESGLRGAHAFASENVEELLQLNTMVIAVDTIHSTEELRIFSRGINYTESNSEEVCNLLYFAGMKNGYDLPTAEFYPGACDSDAFSRVGIKAASICGIAFTPQDYYHNVKDTYTNLNPECIRVVRDILKESVSMFSKAGKIF